jgi:diadenosine tetraphosphate (Ap4A) HIT family hydrolase
VYNLQAAFAPDKMNVASVGNMVPDLHVHITCRRRGDVSWPGPCYGAAPQRPFGSEEQQEMVARLRETLAPPPLWRRLFW